MYSKFVSGLVLVSALVACGGGGSGGFASPEKAAEALAKAFSEGDTSFCEKGMPGPEPFLAAMKCPDAVTEAMTQGMTADRQSAVAECVSTVETVAAEAAGFTVVVKSVNVVKDQVDASPGEEQRNGCKMTKEIRTIEAEVTLTFTKDGESTDDSDTLEFISIANRIYGGI